MTKKPILFHQDLRFFMNDGGSLRDVSIDCLAVLLFEMSREIKKNIIVSFVLEKHAYSLYKRLSSFKETGVYYYPNLSNNERVPGFELENDRYRDEALVQLRSLVGCGVCVGTEESIHGHHSIVPPTVFGRSIIFWSARPSTRTRRVGTHNVRFRSR